MYQKSNRLKSPCGGERKEAYAQEQVAIVNLTGVNGQFICPD